jgi:hypothetical protein
MGHHSDKLYPSHHHGNSFPYRPDLFYRTVPVNNPGLGISYPVLMIFQMISKCCRWCIGKSLLATLSHSYYRDTLSFSGRKSSFRVSVTGEKAGNLKYRAAGSSANLGWQPGTAVLHGNIITTPAVNVIS